MRGTFRYVFRHKETGQRLEVESYAILPAMRSIGVSDETVARLECWAGNQRIWHYDDNCEIQSN